MFEITNRNQGQDITRSVLAIPSTGLACLTIHAEITQRILYLKDDANYLVHPTTFVKAAIKDLSRKEGNRAIKREIKDLLE